MPEYSRITCNSAEAVRAVKHYLDEETRLDEDPIVSVSHIEDMSLCIVYYADGRSRAACDAQMIGFRDGYEALKSKLSEVTKERDDAQANIEALSLIIFNGEQAKHVRTRVVNLCKEKAAEWGVNVRSLQNAADDHLEKRRLMFAAKIDAANELREAIENLDHQGD